MAGVAQTVDVVEPQSLQLSARDQSRDQRMDCSERGGIFDADAGEVVDIEKASIIDRRKCDAPVCDPIVLALEQTMQQRCALIAAIGGDPALDNAVRSLDCRESLFQARSLPVRWRAGIAIVICKRQKSAAPVAYFAGVCHGNADDFRIALWIDRQLVLEIPGGEGAVRCVEPELDLTGLQCVTVRPPENRKQHAGVPPVRERIPVDIEDIGIRRFLAPFQHVEPPSVVGAADAHVVRDEVENEAETMLLERGGQAGKAVLPAELGIEPVMIDDIIAMRASRPSFQEWRGKRCEIPSSLR